MMTLDEAIEHAEWAAANCEGECSEEHRQLAGWLRELADEQRKVLLLMTEANSLRAENEKLRVLARTNWFVALSERDALRIHGVNPDDGAYIKALDETIGEARATMQELGIEVE